MQAKEGVPLIFFLWSKLGFPSTSFPVSGSQSPCMCVCVCLLLFHTQTLQAVRAHVHDPDRMIIVRFVLNVVFKPILCIDSYSPRPPTHKVVVTTCCCIISSHTHAYALHVSHIYCANRCSYCTLESGHLCCYGNLFWLNSVRQKHPHRETERRRT